MTLRALAKGLPPCCLGYQTLEEIRKGADPVEHTNPFDKAEATWYLLDDLLRAIDERREPETSATENLKSMRILEAAYRSMSEGRPVPTEEIAETGA